MRPDPALGALRDANARLWHTVFAEDIGVVEGMQRGRHGELFDGGRFSPVMDSATHRFHAWVAGEVLAGRERRGGATSGARGPNAATGDRDSERVASRSAGSARRRTPPTTEPALRSPSPISPVWRGRATRGRRASDTDACFFLTHAWVFAMAAGLDEADVLRARLVARGRV